MPNWKKGQKLTKTKFGLNLVHAHKLHLKSKTYVEKYYHHISKEFFP